MSKYVVVELTVPGYPGVVVVNTDYVLYGFVADQGEQISQHETLEEARAVAEAIAAFKNLTIRSWSL